LSFTNTIKNFIPLLAYWTCPQSHGSRKI